MASPKRDRDSSNNCIVISNPKPSKIIMQGSKRILKLGDTEFVVNEEQMIAASNFLKRMLIEEKKEIELDLLKEKQPCFDVIGLAIAVSFANGHAKIPLNRIINALAAANALEMWDMHKAISEQLYVLAGQPKSAPFAINVAVCNLGENKAKCIVKHSSIIKKDEKQAAIESVVRAIKIWCGNDDERYTFTKNILNKLRSFCDINIIGHIERLIAANSKTHFPRDKIEPVSDAETQQSTLNMTCTTNNDLFTNSDVSLKFEAFPQIELPAAKSDSNGIHHYSFTIEFETPKELLLSNKPKLIGLQLEAVLKCPNR